MPCLAPSVANTCFILSWLEDIESSNSPRPLKRRRGPNNNKDKTQGPASASWLNTRPPTPPMDPIKDSASMSTSTSRRTSPRRKNAQPAASNPPLSTGSATRQIPILLPPTQPTPAPASINSPPRSVSPNRTLRRQNTHADSTNATSVSSPRRRPKDMVALELSLRPVEPKEVGSNSKLLPDVLGVRELYRKINRLAINPRGVLPHKFKQIFPEDAADLAEDYPEMFIDDPKCAEYFVESQLHQVVDILQEAKFLEDLGGSEAAWNSDVHSQVLKLALAVYRQHVPTHKVEARNITTAHVDTTLRFSSGDQQLPDKLVDFALTVPISDSIYRPLLHQDSIVESLNQTTYGPVCFKPIGVGIETKVKTGSDDRQQLSLWTAAWFQRQSLLAGQARARKLARQEQSDERADAQLDSQTKSSQPEQASLVYPTIVPLLSIRGHEWSLLFMEDYQRSGEDGYAYALYGGPNFGSTKTSLGCFKIIHGLLRLCEWLDGEFQPAMTRFYKECNEAKDKAGE